jgi:fatty-acyl-CoA synthase
MVVREDATVSADELRDFLAPSFPKWWLPERWAFVAAVPKTSVGKFDKKVLRAAFASGDLTVETLS